MHITTSTLITPRYRENTNPSAWTIIYQLFQSKYKKISFASDFRKLPWSKQSHWPTEATLTMVYPYLCFKKGTSQYSWQSTTEMIQRQTSAMVCLKSYLNSACMRLMTRLCILTQRTALCFFLNFSSSGPQNQPKSNWRRKIKHKSYQKVWQYQFCKAEIHSLFN